MATGPRTKTIGRGWRKRDSLTLRYGNEGLTPSTCRGAKKRGPANKSSAHWSKRSSCKQPCSREVVTSIYAPDPLRVARARAEVAAYEEAEAQGKGAVQYEGRMIDAATSRVLRNIIRRADALGM